jgi:gluconolactonase
MSSRCGRTRRLAVVAAAALEAAGARAAALAAAAGAALAAVAATPALAADAYAPRPDAVVDLMTREGAARVRGEWRYSDARIVEVEHRAPGPDLRPSGAPIRTHDIEPKAGAGDFNDSAWPVIDPSTLQGRRSTGRLSFAWYRIAVTIPERIGEFDPAGSTAIFELVADDYAEIWVDGRLPLVLGQPGGALVAGFNAPNRVVLGHDLRPGVRLQIAVFAANGPLSNPPGNFIWLRSATIDFYRHDPTAPLSDRIEVERADARLDAIVPPGARIDRLAGGFEFIEGPVWVPEGYLLFSDPNRNVIHRWSPDGEVSIYRVKSGYSGVDIGRYHQPGSNGLALDREGRLTICEHGNRRVTRLEKNGVLTVLADNYEGKRLNSPNDLVYRSDGVLYFTDPPFGLPRAHDDPARELPYSGVFRLADGQLTLVSQDLSGPNGLAFSPDEKFLYVSNWDPKRKIIMRYEARPDGSLAGGVVFYDMGKAPEAEALDGLKVDRDGNVYASGPGGLWILSPEGDLLGKVRAPELPANLAWGDVDRRALYLTARTGLYRLRLEIPGAGGAPVAEAHP